MVNSLVVYATTAILLVLAVALGLVLFKHFTQPHPNIGIRNQAIPVETRRKNLRTILTDFTVALKKAGATKVVPMYGTLLGLHREGDLLCHDYDVDVGAFATRAQLDKALTLLPKTYQPSPAYKRAFMGDFVQVFHRPSGLHGDIVLLKEDGNKIRRDYMMRRIPLIGSLAYQLFTHEPMDIARELILPTTSIAFESTTVDLPADPRALLTRWYGDQWCAPHVLCKPGCKQCKVANSAEAKKKCNA